MTILNSMLTFFGFSDEDEDSQSSKVIHNVSQHKPTFHHIQPQHQPTPMEIRISFPKNYEDSVNIASHLQHNRSVLVNLQYLDPQTSKRLIDFLCGTAYAMSGNMKKVTDQMFIFSPKNTLIEMAEDISDIEKGAQEYEGYRIENVASF